MKLQHCAHGSDFFQTDSFEIVGHDHPILRKLIKEVRFVMLDGNASFPLLADWAHASLDCKDECIEHCDVEIDVSHLKHYAVFIGLVIVVCGGFVLLMERWARRLKRKTY